jgi:hypothetical protein
VAKFVLLPLLAHRRFFFRGWPHNVSSRGQDPVHASSVAYSGASARLPRRHPPQAATLGVGEPQATLAALLAQDAVLLWSYSTISRWWRLPSRRTPTARTEAARPTYPTILPRGAPKNRTALCGGGEPRALILPRDPVIVFWHQTGALTDAEADRH